MMPLSAIAILALGTLAFRLTGPLLGARVTLPDSFQRLASDAAILLLFALAVTSALMDGQESAGWARPAGVFLAGCLALFRLPFPVVVLAAAAVTAGLRALGIA